MIRIHLLAVYMGCLLDACLGDPHCLWHPVCKIGSLINWLEKGLRKAFPPGERGEKLAGICLVILVLFVTGFVSAFVLFAAYGLSIYAGLLIETIMCYQMMAWRSLKTESLKVYDQLKKGDVEKAREAVSMIVGRDTNPLSDQGITKAAVETVAENTSDGVIAPLISMVLLGGMGVYLYKAVNTMDSMIGYKNEKYLWFGRAAARLDDLCNFIPARVSALLMVLAGYLCQLGVFISSSGSKKGRCPYSGKNGYRIFKRDRFNHKSPNSAQTEAVCAGALQIELAGNAWYFGKLCEKPSIGDPIREIEYEDIKRANCLMTVTYLLALFLTGILFLALSRG